jgi:hypothetical protein
VSWGFGGIAGRVLASAPVRRAERDRGGAIRLAGERRRIRAPAAPGRHGAGTWARSSAQILIGSRSGDQGRRAPLARLCSPGGCRQLRAGCRVRLAHGGDGRAPPQLLDPDRAGGARSCRRSTTWRALWASRSRAGRSGIYGWPCPSEGWRPSTRSAVTRGRVRRSEAVSRGACSPRSRRWHEGSPRWRPPWPSGWDEDGLAVKYLRRLARAVATRASGCAVELGG